MPADPTFPLTRELLHGGLAAHAFPAAVIEVGRAEGPIWEHAVGRLTYDTDAPACDLATIFDLASLTKVIATTSLVMRLRESGRLSLDTHARDLLPSWPRADQRGVTVRHLLDHSSGLPAHARLWDQALDRAAFEAALCALPLLRPPGTHSEYSDPGFMLLGLALERLEGTRLDAQFRTLASLVGEDELWYLPPESVRSRIAPTELDPWRGRLLQGEVHDENAAALGGVAAHAGLFGTARAVGRFARLVLRSFHERTALGSPEAMRLFAARTGVPGSSRALGWDTMLPTSSCGTRLSPSAIGHTGFTGTSLWVDHERGLSVVLLTNRVHPTRDNAALVALRPRVHDAVVADLERQ